MKQVIQYDTANHGPINTFIGFVCGILGGSIDYFVRANTLTIFAMMQAAFTALIYGAAGVAGKELFVVAKKSYLRFKQKKINNKNLK